MLKAIRRLYLSLKYDFEIPSYDGMMSEDQCRFLYHTVINFQGPKEHIVEIGSFKGCSTTWLAMAGKRKHFKSLIAIDLFTGTPSWNEKIDTFDVFMKRMRLNKLVDFVHPLRGDSKSVVKEWNPNNKISILHIDGDHSYEAAKADADLYIPYVVTGGIIIFDDYDSFHPEVKQVVGELLEQKRFEQIGIVTEKPLTGNGSIALKKVF